MPESPNHQKDIFLKALDIASADERAAYLTEACAGDDTLRRQIDAMLQAHAKPDSFLEKPAAALDATVDADDAIPLAPILPDTTIGTRIGPYKLLEQIGEGGMGVVYTADQHEPVRRKVALKIIKPGMDSGQVLARFEAERQALALMDHPNIAKVLDAGATRDGRPFFVMELVKGTPITKFCDERRLSPRERLELFVLVCQAIQHAHQKGVIHRDIKPSNVLVALYDDKPVPKVIDFGVAKATGQALTEKTLDTGFGAIVGTPEYMSPEQATFNQLDIDTRSDVYALGVLLYELLTGATPVDKARLKEAALLEVLRIVREEEPPRPSVKMSTSTSRATIAATRGIEADALSRLMRGELDWIVMKSLEKDRTRRYETASSLARDVERYLKDELVEARPPTARYRLRKFVNRNRGTVTAASVVLLTIVLGIIGTTWGWVDALQARKDEKEALGLAMQNEKLAEKRRGDAEKLAEANKLLAGKEAKARLEADYRREHAETLALQIEFEHYYSKAEIRPDLALVGMASLLPKAVRLKNPSMADMLRLHVGAWSRREVRLNAQCAHQNQVIAVAVSADGKTALTGSGDKTARLWETATGQPIGPPLQHQGSVAAVALSADGKTALTGSNDKTARFWDTATGKPMGQPLQHQDEVGGVAVSADGKAALTGSKDKTARLWEVTTGKQIGPPLQHQDEVRIVALSSDGKTALTGSFDKKTAWLWETATGKPIGPPLQHQGAVLAVALSADGRTALTGSVDKTARLWETATGKPIGLPLQHQGGVAAVALSADGKIALTGGADKAARLWDSTSGKPIGLPLQHQGGVIAVALSADGRIALTGGADKAAQLWNTTTCEPIGPPLLHQYAVFLVALSADGKTAVTGNHHNKAARLWQSAIGKPVRPPLRHPAEVRAVALSADGMIALTGSWDKTARLWHTASGTPIGPPLQHQGFVHAVALSGDGKLALTGCWDKMARLWDTATGKPIGPALQHQGAVLAVALSADGKMALTGSFNRTARLWETATGKSIGPPLQHQDLVVAVALSADGRIALTGSYDKTAQLCEVATGKPIGPPLQHQADVMAVALSADGKMALTGCFDKTARLWETATGKLIGPPLQHQDEVVAVALSADGKTALTGSHDKTARLWQTATGKLIGPPLQHQGRVNAVALSADGKTALTGSADKTVRLFNVPQPVRGEPERIKLWTQVITGFEVDELTAVHILDPATWEQRRQRLQDLGGPPAP